MDNTQRAPAARLHGARLYSWGSSSFLPRAWIAKISPPSGAGVGELQAGWATATNRTSGSRRRLRPLRVSTSSPCRLGTATASPATPTAQSGGEGDFGCLGHGEDLSNQLLPKKIEAWAPELQLPANAG